MIRQKKVVRGVVASERYDLTDQSDLLALNLLFLQDLTPALSVSPSVYLPTSATLIPPILIEEGVTIGENTTVGPFAYLERGSSVRSGVSIERSIVLRDASASTNCNGVVVVPHHG
jgi:NDP-sugar pyrophosphorylase family protein